MSLLDTASLIVTPNGYKEGKLYSVIPSDGSGDLSVTRATTATRVNSAGLVELVPYNFQTQSEYQTGWVSEEADITINNTTAPNGTLTGAKIVATATNAVHKGYPPNVIGSLISGATYTASVYMKANGYNFGYIRDGYSGYYVIFNLQTGAVSSTNSATGSIESVGNGWYRCIATMSTVTANFRMDTGICQTSAQTTQTNWLGDGVNGIYIWGAQLVEGSTAKDYQKTETRLNIPRLDYSNGTCPSLLVEPQRTNIATNSENFATYTTFQASVTSNDTTAPNGLQTADKITTTGSGSGSVYIPSVSLATGSNTASCYFKAGNSNLVAIDSNGSGGYWGASFNLSNQTYTLFGITSSASIEEVGNGWYRCSVTASTSSTAYLAFGVIGNTGSTAYAWGAQLEVGSYATSYIPTTSASVTRNADVISKTGISSLIGQTEGTMFFDVYAQLNTADEQDLSISDGTGNNRAIIRLTSSGTIRGIGVFGGNLEFNIGGSAYTTGTRYKIALAYKNNDVALYVNGTSQGTSSSTTISGTLSRLGFDVYTNGAQTICSPTNAVALWKTRLTNTQLAQLTTI
jgi:hypothetical protein